MGERSRWKDPNYGRVKWLKGNLREVRVLGIVAALTAGPNRPALCPWILSVRYATPSEDRGGIDVVVETDIGPLWLQVKATKAACKGFKEAVGRNMRPRYHEDIGVVAVPDPVRSDVRAHVLEELVNLYQHRRMSRMRDTSIARRRTGAP